MFTAKSLWDAISHRNRIEFIRWMSYDISFFKHDERELLKQLAKNLHHRCTESLPELSDEMKNLCNTGEKIQAIKLYRDENSKYGLLEAKIRVDAYMQSRLDLLATTISLEECEEV